MMADEEEGGTLPDKVCLPGIGCFNSFSSDVSWLKDILCEFWYLNKVVVVVVVGGVFRSWD